jgi:Mn2+/Fe2+ NRAMP family transporter
VLANLDGFWIFHSQLTSPIPPFETYHKPCVGCACGLIGLGIFFSSLVALIVTLWSTSYRSSTNFNFLSSLSRTFFAFDGIPLGKLIFFFVGKGCASWGK